MKFTNCMWLSLLASFPSGFHKRRHKSATMNSLTNSGRFYEHTVLIWLITRDIKLKKKSQMAIFLDTSFKLCMFLKLSV